MVATHGRVPDSDAATPAPGATRAAALAALLRSGQLGSRLIEAAAAAARAARSADMVDCDAPSTGPRAA